MADLIRHLCCKVIFVEVVRYNLRTEVFMKLSRLSLLPSWCALAFLTAALLMSCAGSRDSAPAGDDGMADAPCTECGTQGEIELKITDEKFYREWNPVAFGRIDSNAVVGVFPALKVTANRPEKCKMCHSFSADAVDFDLARVEDSLFVKAFPKMTRELMLPGMRVPDADSAYIDTLSVKLLAQKFVEGKRLDDVTPWEERDGVEQTLTRQLPFELSNLLNKIASRYELRYLTIPLLMEVTMDPDLGKKGGFQWQIVWSMWDARYGELVCLTYSKFTAVTTTRVAPEKEWATPFASRLWRMFSVDVAKFENH